MRVISRKIEFFMDIAHEDGLDVGRRVQIIHVPRPHIHRAFQHCAVKILLVLEIVVYVGFCDRCLLGNQSSRRPAVAEMPKYELRRIKDLFFDVRARRSSLAAAFWRAADSKELELVGRRGSHRASSGA